MARIEIPRERAAVAQGPLLAAARADGANRTQVVLLFLSPGVANVR
jgi:hypothetical protein